MLFDPSSVLIFQKLTIAMLCGVIIGTERIISHKAAGMRTYALVSMGAALFIILGQSVVTIATNPTGAGVAAIIQGIITGVGFMGAGVIIFRDSSVTGLTTASGLWVASGIGVACGFGLFVPALLTTFLTLFVLIILWHIEQRVKKMGPHDPTDTPQTPLQ